jgi:hypothetical protein
MSNPASSPSPRPITWDETSDSGPGALENLLVWRGRGNNEINLSAMPDDQGKWQLGETTAASPGVAGFNNKTWIAWTGTHDQFDPDFGRLNVTNTEDPRKHKVTLPDEATSDIGLALAAFNGQLYLSWVGTNGFLNVIRSNDGRKWQDKVTLRESSDDRPALATFGGVLYLAWKGTNRQPNVILSQNGRDFYGKQNFTDRCVGGPGLAVYRDKLYLGWPDFVSLGLIDTLDGVNWSRTQQFDQTSVDSVALSVVGGNLAFCWTGRNSKLNLMYPVLPHT